MHTKASDARTTHAPKRRLYSPELKLQVVCACTQPGASIAGVTLQHGINANIVHRWLREHSQGILVIQPQAFTPVTLSTDHEPVAATKEVRMELRPRRKAVQLKQSQKNLLINSLSIGYF